jgi:hypothetical protein
MSHCVLKYTSDARIVTYIRLIYVYFDSSSLLCVVFVYVHLCGRGFSNRGSQGLYNGSHCEGQKLKTD